MCGIAGFWRRNNSTSQSSLTEQVEAMAATLRHRGDDSSGAWADAGSGVAFSHARLSILDLSEAGHQPMLSTSGRYIITYNGEVYNHLELRPELEQAGHSFRGHSDTETILAAISEWGLEKSLERFNGMFAFALWDTQQKKLTLVRDRIGIKPLYYGFTSSGLVFGSELKALKASNGFDNPVNRDALSLYCRYNYVPEPYAIYENVYKLLPGTVLTFSEPTAAEFSPHEKEARIAPHRYYSLKDIYESNAAQGFEGSFEDATNELEKKLTAAVKRRMISDVPLGAFLSGGIDSSVVVALMQSISDKPIKTFTIGNENKFYNEATHAAAVARHLGTEHTELYVTAKDALGVIPSLADMYDEPFSDYSQIPTYLVSKLARESVTVALSGDGGDELFAGYRRHFQAAPFWDKISCCPHFLRQIPASILMKMADSGCIDYLANNFPYLLPASFKSGSAADSARKAAQVLGASSIPGYYQALTSQWQDPASVVLAGNEPKTFASKYDFDKSSLASVRGMMYLDMMMYHPDDILTKVDRASMAVTLEARVPLIDYEVIDFASRLPLDFLIKNGQGKRILREVLHRHVPKELVERPKMGFSIPLGDWLGGELRDWGEELLSVTRLEDQGYFNPQIIRKKWDEHITGKRDWKYQLWNVLMFQAWLEKI